MRIVWSPDDFESQFESATREALNAFGDDQFIVEKFVDRPRHVEVQVFGDKHGNYVHLFERDCTTQRRHQKVIEEAPGPNISNELRSKLGEAAVAAARAVDYVGAGTVEFIMDQTGEFYFMEMNTRLQVEHPVTEMITGQDLVEWQLKVASGAALPLSQSELQINGHAAEARIYAENPLQNFLPATGVLRHLEPPDDSDGTVRVETGVLQGDTVSMWYDPMICKLVVWDKDRASALRKLNDKLGEYQVAGVPTNIGFLRRLAQHPSFVGFDQVDTSFIEKHYDELVLSPEATIEDPSFFSSLSLLSVGMVLQQANRSMAGNWRLNGSYSMEIALQLAELDITVALTQHSPQHFTVQFGDKAAEVQVGDHCAESGMFDAQVDGQRLQARVLLEPDQAHVFRPCGNNLHFGLPQLAALSADGAGDQAGLLSPMPGRVTKLLVAAGATVTKGTPIIAMEAMKMEHLISAPADGVVEQLLYAVGDQVPEKKPLVEFSASE